MAGNGASNSGTKCFVKILVADFKERLRIPDTFVEYMVQQSLKLYGTATLHSPNGNCCKVKFSKMDKGVYFEDGWEIFARDCSFAYCQLLLFRYIGSMHFDVVVFDRSTSELKDALNVISAEGAICGCQSRGYDGTCELNDALNDKPAEGAVCGRQSGENDGTSELSDALNDELAGGAVASGRQSRGYDASPSVRRSTGKRKRMDAALPFSSPYFVVNLKASSVGHPYNLTVPKQFAKTFLPQYTTTLFLKDDETTTEVTLYVRERQTCITSGWRAVVTRNDLREGDRCAFELVDKDVMQVHILFN